jgi:HAD superfamily hydrolase (TIGR01457 family)
MVDLIELKSKTKKMELLKNVKYFVLDLDGTFYIEDHIIDGSLDFLKQLDKMGIECRFFTNNSSKDAQCYIDRIAKMGYQVPPEAMMISNHVIIEYLKSRMPGKRVFVLGTEYLQGDFSKAGIELVEEEPDIVVVGFDTTLRYDRLAKACDYIRNGAVFLAVNPDFNCPVKDGFIPDCGSICALITASTGVEPVYFGKPTPFALEYIKNNTGAREDEIAFVGDRLYTDIALGSGTNLITILVLTGETKEKDLLSSEIKPKLLFQSLEDIKDLLVEMEGL